MTPPKRRILCVLWLALAAAGARGNTSECLLRDARFEDGGREAVLTLLFSREPHIRYTPMTESRILILDFQNAAFPSGSERFSPVHGLVEYLSLAQFDASRLRMVLKVAPGSLVNVYKYPVAHSSQVRYTVVALREESLDRYPTNIGPKTRPRIVIDPGHGGYDNGASGTITTDKEVALSIAREIKRLFDADPRVEVFYTRLTDHFVTLDDRSNFARRVEADGFVSFHGNMIIGNRWIRGTEVYYLSERGANKEIGRVLEERGAVRPGRRRAAVPLPEHILLSMQQAKSIESSCLLASILSEKIYLMTHQPSRGVKRAAFKVLRPIGLPACLVEFGYLSNSADQRLIASEIYHRTAARAVYEGIIEWLIRTGKLRGPGLPTYARTPRVPSGPAGAEMASGTASGAETREDAPDDALSDPLTIAREKLVRSTRTPRHGGE